MPKKLRFREVADEGLKLDLGTGKGANRPEGFLGVDIRKAPGVKVVDLRRRWPWKSGSVAEINAHYFMQYLTPGERIHVLNEAHRVLKPGGKMVIVSPHWCASKAYGDPGAHYPPLAEAWFMMVSRDFREAQNFVIDGYECDFDCTLGYLPHPALAPRAQEYVQNALNWYKEAAQDIAATLTKK